MIFISYRRDDTGHIVQNLLDPALRRTFPREKLFLDIDSLRLGIRDFDAEILTTLDCCRVVLVVIGGHYLTIEDRDRGGRRIDNPADYVHREVAHSLARPDVRIIPLIVPPARFLEASDLPAPLHGLVRCNGMQLRSGRDFETDMATLTREIERIMATTPAPAATTPLAPPAVSGSASESSAHISGPAQVFLEKMKAFLSDDNRVEVRKLLAVVSKMMPATHPELHGWQALVDHWHEEEAAAEAQRLAHEEAQRLEREAREAAARHAQEERDRKAREEAERLAREKAEAERKAREEAEAAERMWRTAQIVTNSIGMQLRLIRAGKFVMGDKEQDDNPPHTVTLTKDFRIGVFPVTNAQFRQFRPKHDSGKYKGHSLNGDDRPVVNISWNDAKEFCEWLTIREGRTYRLPTEAEWEYCCRAGRSNEQSKYPWGPNWPPTGKAGNYADITAKRAFSDSFIIDGYDDGYAVTSPVGQFDPNPWGLYDMGGNVWEWCLDAYDSNFCKRDATDPLQQSGSSRVLRGASWNSSHRSLLRAAYRFDPTRRDDNFGFRVVVC